MRPSIPGIRTAVLGSALTAVLLALTVAAAPAPDPAAAERAVLDRVIEDGAVHTARPTPGVTLYIQDLLSAIFSRFLGLLEGIGPMGAVLGRVAVIGASVLFAGALVLLGYAAWRFLSAARRRPPEERTVRTVAPEAELAGRSRADWRKLLEQRLASGDVEGACEALWWWLARGLTTGPVEASWTSRELLDHTGRRELTPGVRQLDRMIYGAVRPAVEDVRGIWGELRRAVRETVPAGAGDAA